MVGQWKKNVCFLGVSRGAGWGHGVHSQGWWGDGWVCGIYQPSPLQATSLFSLSVQVTFSALLIFVTFLWALFNWSTSSLKHGAQNETQQSYWAFTSTRQSRRTPPHAFQPAPPLLTSPRDWFPPPQEFDTAAWCCDSLHRSCVAPHPVFAQLMLLPKHQAFCACPSWIPLLICEHFADFRSLWILLLSFGACRPSEVDVLCIPTLITWVISKNIRQPLFTAACSSPFCTFFSRHSKNIVHSL